MKSFLLGLFLFVLWAIPTRWYYVCQIRGLCDDQTQVVSNDASSVAKTLALSYKDSTILSNYDQFSFGKNVIDPSMSDNNKSFLQSTADYLASNPNKMLTVTGYYRPSEANEKSGMFENLGLARAAAIRDQLVKMGVPENRILLDYKLAADDNLSESLAFNLTDMDNSKKAATDQFVFTNMTFSDANFASNSADFNPNAQFETYADSVVTYLKINKTKNLTITGHTDNVGEDAPNMSLGKRRAESVKKYFKNKGVAATINTASKGEAEPMASNDTEEGKAKNRRVNIRIE